MDSHSTLILEAHDIQKNFYHPVQVKILQSVSLQVRMGESVAIIGRSGEGKSTLLQILGTLEQPCSGTLTIDNQVISSSNKSQIRNELIGFVFQSFHLLEDYTALENVLMPARIGRKSVAKGSLTEQRGMELLHQVGLQERAHFHTKLLSGGEKQRIALARAMCNDPKLIFADEPSGNLDRQTAHLMHDILLKFIHGQQKALVLVTHDPELAKLCSSQYELINGRLYRR
ncbi:ABC transporter ATP-binding protein [Candidatus Protochlamydia sp. R18]|uniref:ABC transporter ATP-binding protein n=1 Tax=Candidatus Protochlamydia sp. R18 TaxID=1353977 RepID=UPI0005AA6075|nr:ABC transporter ATP-binding protein [Candidatus Protochlamydia sp. R18]